MRTKEEIIRSLDWSSNTNLEAAFDEYAKEIAIDFRVWYKSKVMHLCLDEDDMSVTEFVSLPAEELFDKYQQEKSSLK